MSFLSNLGDNISDAAGGLFSAVLPSQFRQKQGRIDPTMAFAIEAALKASWSTEKLEIFSEQAERLLNSLGANGNTLPKDLARLSSPNRVRELSRRVRNISGYVTNLLIEPLHRWEYQMVHEYEILRVPDCHMGVWMDLTRSLDPQGIDDFFLDGVRRYGKFSDPALERTVAGVLMDELFEGTVGLNHFEFIDSSGNRTILRRVPIGVEGKPPTPEWA